jgi:hypothetical protein
MRYIVLMNMSWKLRILLGPMKQFIGPKIVEAVFRIPEKLRFSTRRVVPIHEGLHTVSGVMPLPSASWFREHSSQVLDFALSMQKGTVSAYGLHTWTVGDPDPQGQDIRSVHELSRMHHWCAYALAAHIEPQHTQHWAAQFEREVATFNASYDRSSVHWQFPMGNALRVFSMLVAWDWLQRSGYQNADTDRMIAARAAEHGVAVYLQRESKGGLSTSHYAANLIGLLAVDTYVKGATALPPLASFIRREVQREARRQFLQDGMVQEASTGYHRHVVDIFMLMAVLYRGSGQTVPEDLLPALEKGLDALRTLESIGMPLIGDNDDGMAMKLTGFAPDTALTYDFAALLGITPALNEPYTSFPDFGLDVWKGQLFDVTLRNGHVGQFGKGGHAHHDQNSITVSVQGSPLIIDPGTSLYTYSEQVRNQERSVHAHATMWPVDIEQGYIHPGAEGLFWLPSFDVDSSVLERNAMRWKGRVVHASGVAHTREVQLPNAADEIHCTDLMHLNGVPYDAELLFPLAPEVHVDLHDDHAFLTTGRARIVLQWRGGTGSVRQNTIAPAFANPRLSKMLVLTGNTLSWVLRRS